MTLAPQVRPDPTERGLRILAEMLEQAAVRERPILRVLEVDDDDD